MKDNFNKIKFILEYLESQVLKEIDIEDYGLQIKLHQLNKIIPISNDFFLE